MNDQEMKDMLIDYMGRGFLDNIIALFRQDVSLFRFVGDMMGAENIRVRLGAMALVEEFAGDRRDALKDSVPGLVALLRHETPTIRGDAAMALGIIKDPSAVAALRESTEDAHPDVREAAKDALCEISGC